MEKYHKFISVAFALVYVFLLTLFPVNKPVFRVFAVVMTLFLVGLFLYNKKYLEKKLQYKPLLALGLVSFYLSATCVFFFLPNAISRNLFLIFIFISGASFQILLGNFAESLFLSQSMLTIFFFFSAWMFANFNFPKYYAFYLLGVFVSTVVVSRSFFEFLPQPNQVKNLVAGILGLLCCQMFWVENFLPLYPAVLGFLLFNFFNFILVISNYYLFKTLNLQKIKFHLVFVTLSSLLVLMSTPFSVIK